MLRFAPDLDPTTPDVLTAVDDYVPTVRGYQAMYDESVKTPALGAKSQGLYLATKLDGTTRLIAGQATSLQEYSSGSWTSRGTYTTGDNRWQFAQFGDATLAVRPDVAIQQSTSTTFSTISNAPKAKAMAVCMGFVMVGNYDNGSAVKDGWFCSGIYDHTQWTPSVATQCANGRLFDTPGEITAIHRLGDDLVIFKKDSCYHARYVGPPVIWEIRLISPQIGCPSPEGVCNIGGALVWASDSDFWLYNGAGLPQSIGDGVREFWRRNSFNAYRNLTLARHDPENYRAFFWYISGDAASQKLPDKYLCFNYRSQIWGAGSKVVEDVLRWESDLTYDDLGDIIATYDPLPPETYGSSIWTDAKIPNLTITNSSHEVATMNGAPGSCSITTGDIGEIDQFTVLRRVTPRLITSPLDATLTYYGRPHLEDDITEAGSVSIDSRKRFDFFQAARWHRIKFATTGSCEITGFKPDFVPQGIE
jgi:hypothetical protein